MNKTTEALKLAELVEASMEECMGDDGMVAVIPLDLYNDMIDAIREVLANPEITTPDVCGEVCARAKLCYGCNKDLEEANAKHAEQAEQEPVGCGYEYAEKLAKDRYKVVPSHSSMFHGFAVAAGEGEQHLYVSRKADCENVARKLTGAFLDGAFAATHLYAAPVRTKYLTDEELEECVHIADSECTEDACMPWFIEFARAVIAAYKEKNNANNNS